MDNRFHGKRSRTSLRKIANKLIGACHRKPSVSKEKRERKHNHQPKMPGEVQIDKKYVPVSCFAEVLENPERVERLRIQIRQRAIHECNCTLRSLYADLEHYPALEKTICYCCKEAISQYVLFCQSNPKCHDVFIDRKHECFL